MKNYMSNIFEEIRAAEKTARAMSRRITSETEENRFLDMLEELDNRAEFEYMGNEKSLNIAHRRIAAAMDVAVFNKERIIVE